MQRTIVLEGPDGAGKSTLGEVLSKAFNRPLVHTGGANRTPEQLEARLASIEAHSPGVIFDRVSHISQWIYEETATDQPHLLPQEEMLQRLRERVHPIIVYCRRHKIDDMLSSILATPKPHKPPEYTEKVKPTFPKIVELYDRVMLRAPMRFDGVIWYDWETMTRETLIKWISRVEEAS